MLLGVLLECGVDQGVSIGGRLSAVIVLVALVEGKLLQYIFHRCYIEKQVNNGIMF